MKNNKRGRRRIGQPISITLTDEQRAWVQAQVKPGETKMVVIRNLIQREIEADKAHVEHCEHVTLHWDLTPDIEKEAIKKAINELKIKHLKY